MNTISISFIECDPAPVNGYNLKWRVAGSGDLYTDEGNFSSSPFQFIDNINPPGTCYEGFLQSDCTESGASGSFLGNAIPWATPCAEESGATTYDIELAAPCAGVYSNYLITGGNPGDVVTVRAQFVGLLQKIALSFTRADLVISSPDGTTGNSASACYSDTSPHSFSITADTVITMAGTTAVVTLQAVVHNSSESATSVILTIIDVNGNPHNIFVSGCRGNSSTGGDC